MGNICSGICRTADPLSRPVQWFWVSWAFALFSWVGIIIAHISIRLNMHAQRGEEGIGRHHSGSKWMLRYAWPAEWAIYGDSGRTHRSLTYMGYPKGLHGINRRSKAACPHRARWFFRSLDLIDSSIWLLSIVKPKTPPWIEDKVQLLVIPTYR